MKSTIFKYFLLMAITFCGIAQSFAQSSNGASQVVNDNFSTNIDPRVTPIFGVRGTLVQYIPDPSGASVLLQKQDDGTTTDWVNVGAGGSGTVTSVGLSLPATFIVTGSPVTTSGTLTATYATEPANTFFSGPASGAAATPTFRAIVTADLPASGVTPGTYGDATHVSQVTVDATGRITTAANVAITGGSGTVTSVGFADASTTPIYTITNSPVTTSGTLTQTLTTEAANSVFAGPTTGAASQPGFRTLVIADIPSGLPYANQTLSNLTSPTAINQNLLPAGSNNFTSGNAANYWTASYEETVNLFNPGLVFQPSVVEGLGATTPSGATSGSDFRTLNNTSTSNTAQFNLNVFTGSDSGANAIASGNIQIETGNKTAGTGDSGSINLITGTSSGGAQGAINMTAIWAVLPKASADPSGTPPSGAVYYNTTSNLVRFYNGTSWTNL